MLVSCLSPTLPMPPPNEPEIEGPDARGVVVLSGHAPAESLVYADNETTGYSFGQRAHAITGRYRFPIWANFGDSISVFYRVDGEDSMSTKFVIRSSTANSRGAGGAPGVRASGEAGSLEPPAASSGIAGSTSFDDAASGKPLSGGASAGGGLAAVAGSS